MKPKGILKKEMAETGNFKTRIKVRQEFPLQLLVKEMKLKVVKLNK